jgi:high-affinity K+ transport system ATPase subunit B
MSDVAKFYIVPAVLYAVVASPATYQTTRNVLGSWVATSEGTAKLGGLILHALVFILLASLAMRYFPAKRSGYNHPGGISQQEGMNTKLQEVPHMLAPAPY